MLPKPNKVFVYSKWQMHDWSGQKKIGVNPQQVAGMWIIMVVMNLWRDETFLLVTFTWNCLKIQIALHNWLSIIAQLFNKHQHKPCNLRILNCCQSLSGDGLNEPRYQIMPLLSCLITSREVIWTNPSKLNSNYLGTNCLVKLMSFATNSGICPKFA